MVFLLVSLWLELYEKKYYLWHVAYKSDLYEGFD